MVSKNNRMKKMEQAAECQSHFAIRKLTIGAASVLLGTTLWLNNGNVVKADTNSDKGDTNQASQASNNSVSNSADAKKVVVVAENSQTNPNESQKSEAESVKNTDSIQTEKQNSEENASSAVKEDSKLADKNLTSSEKTQTDQKSAQAALDKDEATLQKKAAATQVEKAKENTAKVPVFGAKQKDINSADNTSISEATNQETDKANKVDDSLAKNNTAADETLAQAGQQGKKSAEAKSEQLNLFQIGEKGKVQSDLTKDKKLTDQEKSVVKQKENILNLTANKEAALDPEKVKQLSNLSTEQIAQLYGTSLVQANSIKGIFDSLKGLDFSKIKDSVSQIVSTVKDPDVQKAAKDLMGGKLDLSTLNDLRKASQKIGSLTTGLKGLAGELSKNAPAGSSTGNILDKLKGFKLPDITKIKPAIDGINTAMKDPSVQKVIKDVTSGNISSVIMDMGTALPTIEQSLAPLNSLVKDATGVDIINQVKSKLPDVDPTTLSNAFNGVTGMIKDPAVQKAIKDITSGSPSLSDVTAIPKIINGLKPVGNLVKDLLPHKGTNTPADPNKDQGKTSWFDKLKKLVPSFTSEEITAAKNAIQRTISDPLIKNVVTDVITQNYPKLLMDVIHYGPTTFKNAKTSIEEITKAIKDAKAQKDQNTTYTYTINYMNGKDKVTSQQVSGKPGDTRTISIKLPDGYALPSGSSVPGTYTFTNKNDSIDVQVVTKKPVNPDAKEHTLTIKYVLADGSVVGTPQTITGKEGATKPITATIPAGYELDKGSNIPGLYTFKDTDDTIKVNVVKSKDNPNNPNTNPDNPNTKPDNPNTKPDNPNTKPDKPDTPVVEQKAQLIIVDQDDNDNQIKADGIDTSFVAKGKSGDAISFDNPINSVSKLQSLGYVFVSNNTPQNIKFDNDSDSDQISQTYQIVMRHGVQEVTSATDPSAIPSKAQSTVKPADLTKKINLTVNYVNADKTQFTGELPANAKQTITFNGTVYVDKVTGKVVNVRDENGTKVVDNGNLAIPEISWKADNDEFSAVVSPKENGYKVVSVSSYSVGDNVDKITKLTPTSGDIKITVVYGSDKGDIPTPPKQGSVSVVVFDQTANKLLNGYGYATGKVDEDTKVNFAGHDKLLQDLEKKGYDIVSDPTADLPKTVGDRDLTYRLIVKHHIIIVDPDNPATPGSLIVSENSYNKYPSDTDASHLTHTVTRTITYKGTPTEQAQVVDSLKFTAKGYLDAVSGKWTTQDGHELQDQANHYTWTSHDGNKFGAVASPYFKNYHVANVSADGNGYGDVAGVEDIDQNSKNINIVVNYAPNGEIIAVDKDGKEIAQRTQYITNPANLTKVMPEEAVSEVKGYTTDTKTVTPIDPAVNTSVTYTAIPVKVKKGRVIINVHDSTANSDLTKYSYDTKRREVGFKLDFNKASVIADLEKAGYKVINPEVTIPKKVTKGKHAVTIYVEHEVVPVTEDNNPQKVVLTKTATQTVHYEGAGELTPQDNVETIKFTHKVSMDKATGELIDNGWTPEAQSYKVVVTPNVAGYTASVNAVGGDSVSPDGDNNRIYTVSYTKNPVLVQANVSYIDDVTGNVLENRSLIGNSGDVVKYDPAKKIAYYESKGYKLVQNDLNGEKKLADTNNDFTIHFTHTTSKLDSNNLAANYTKNDLDKTITRVVKYVYADGTKTIAPIKQEVHLTATGTVDNVTGQLVTVQDGKILPNGKLTWTASNNGEFAEIPALDLGDYYISNIKENGTSATVANNGQIASEKVNSSSPNAQITITLSKKAPVNVVGSVNYIDDTTGKVIEVRDINGEVGQLVDYNAASEIAKYEKQGYKLVSSDLGKNSTFTKDDNNYDIHLAHTTSNIDSDHLAGNYTKSDLTKQVSRIIKYVYADGTKTIAPIKQVVDFDASGTIDNVTGQLVTVQDGKIIRNGKLTWNKSNNGEFDAVSAPDFGDYYVSGIRQNNSQADVSDNGQVTGEKVSPDSENSNIVITLSKKAPVETTASIVYYDDTMKAPVETIKLGGKVGQAIDYNTNDKVQAYIKQGYKLVANDLSNGQKLAKDAAGNKFEIHLVHATSPVNDEKTVTRDVAYVDESGKEILPAVKQSVTFKGQATKDAVTGKLVNLNGDGSIKDQNGKMDWTSEDNTFAAIPALDTGKYTVVAVKENGDNVNIKNGQVASEAASADSQNSNIKITLNKVVAKKGSIAVVVHDATAKKDLAAYTKSSGEEIVGSPFDYDLAGRISELENKGYKVINKDLTIPREIAAGDQKLVLYVEHKVEPVTNQRDVTRSITYVDENGNKLAPSVTQTVHFVQSGEKDKVTGEFTKPLTWDNTGVEVQNAVSPTIAGYHVVKVSKDGENNDVKATTLKNTDSSYDVLVTYAKDPVKPDNTKPSGKTDPVKPDNTKPSGKTDPVKPDNTKPNGNADPVKPDNTKPSDNTNPVKPDNTKPSDNTDPVKPDNTKPSDNTGTTTNTSDNTQSNSAADANQPVVTPTSSATTDSEATSASSDLSSQDNTVKSEETTPSDSVPTSDNNTNENEDDSDYDDSSDADDSDDSMDTSEDSSSVSSQSNEAKNKSDNWKQNFVPHAEKLSNNNSINLNNNSNNNNNFVETAKNIQKINNKKLPQTSQNNQENAAQAILGASAVTLGMIGLAGIKKRRKRD